MKTNKLVARLRVQKLDNYFEIQKGYIISLLAEQAAKVFEGLLKENDELFELTKSEENCEQGQIEFALVVEIKEQTILPDCKFTEQGRNLAQKERDAFYLFYLPVALVKYIKKRLFK